MTPPGSAAFSLASACVLVHGRVDALRHLARGARAAGAEVGEGGRGGEVGAHWSSI